MSGVSSDRRIAATVKRTVYKMVVRPAVIYGLDMTALTKWNDETRMDTLC